MKQISDLLTYCFMYVNNVECSEATCCPLNITTLVIPGKTTVLINLSAGVLTVQSWEASRGADNLLSVWL